MKKNFLLLLLISRRVSTNSSPRMRAIGNLPPQRNSPKANIGDRPQTTTAKKTVSRAHPLSHIKTIHGMIENCFKVSTFLIERVGFFCVEMDLSAARFVSKESVNETWSVFRCFQRKFLEFVEKNTFEKHQKMCVQVSTSKFFVQGFLSIPFFGEKFIRFDVRFNVSSLCLHSNKVRKLAKVYPFLNRIPGKPVKLVSFSGVIFSTRKTWHSECISHYASPPMAPGWRRTQHGIYDQRPSVGDHSPILLPRGLLPRRY